MCRNNYNTVATQNAENICMIMSRSRAFAHTHMKTSLIIFYLINEIHKNKICYEYINYLKQITISY